MTNSKDQIQFFEGAEKVLELWFSNSSRTTCNQDLRRIPRQKLESLLKLVHCEVISFSSNENIDAYVLSESSMFVSKRRFILKTCGTTTPLECIKLFLMFVQQYSGFDDVEKVFYSRKNFKRPEFQQNVHKDFKFEVDFLDSCFKNKGIGMYIKNDEDCWYLYTLNCATSNFESSSNKLFDEPDQTIEILMSNLDSEVMNNFKKGHFLSASEVTKYCGIDKLIPFVEINDYLFDPCGYSMNGILQNGCYMTIHVTPQPEFSYVSFESNVPFSSYKDLIKRVVNIFQPGKFIVALFANEKSVAAKTPKELKNLSKIGEHWRQLSCDFCYISDYDMSVAFYSKFPS